MSNISQNLVRFDYTVLKAFSPHFAIDYLRRNKTAGWKSLGGVLLAFTGEYRICHCMLLLVLKHVKTGVEALYADLGAFSARQVPALTRLLEVEYLADTQHS